MDPRKMLPYEYRDSFTRKDALDWLARHEVDPVVLAAVAGNRKTRKDTLDWLARTSQDPVVLAAVAGNRKTRKDTLGWLARTSQDPAVRSAVAGNPNAGAVALMSFVHDDDLEICLSVLRNPGCEWLNYICLSSNPNAEVRLALAKSGIPTLFDLCAHLADDEDERVRRAAWESMLDCCDIPRDRLDEVMSEYSGDGGSIRFLVDHH